MNKQRIILGLLLFTFGIASNAQTCCTGGTPLLGSYVFSNTAKGNWIIHSTMNHNSNQDLVAGENQVDESFISRRVNAGIIQLDYGLSDELAISLVVPYLMQRETISQQGNNSTFKNNGLGDILLWGKYQVQKFNYDLSLAIGLKIPTGNTKKSDGNGFPLPFSMQLGSGSFDLGFNVQSRHYLTESRKFSIANQIAFKLNSKGKSFEAHPNYRFGNQFQALSVFSYRYIVHSLVSQLFFGGIYQFRAMDKFDGGFINENTGGHWINLTAGQTTGLNQKIDVGLNFSLPVYRNLNGLQLSTTWQGAFIISYKLIKKNDSVFDSL